jgi:transcriptional regulator
VYAPSYNRPADRAEVLAFMRANAFAVFVTGTGGALHATHLPVEVCERPGALVLAMHMARANPQGQALPGGEALVVFSGPHAYVSPRWYAERERVPTWNYAAVHAYGTVEVIDEAGARLAAQERLVALHDPGWLDTFRQLPRGYVRRMLEGIVNFELTVTRLEARWKLSQNRGRDEQERIAAALERSGEANALALAGLTRRHRAPG